MWRPIILLLAEKFTVIAPDLPVSAIFDSGKSMVRRRGKSTISALIED